MVLSAGALLACAAKVATRRPRRRRNARLFGMSGFCGGHIIMLFAMQNCSKTLARAALGRNDDRRRLWLDARLWVGVYGLLFWKTHTPSQVSWLRLGAPVLRSCTCIGSCQSLDLRVRAAVDHDARNVDHRCHTSGCLQSSNCCTSRTLGNAPSLILVSVFFVV